MSPLELLNTDIDIDPHLNTDSDADAHLVYGACDVPDCKPMVWRFFSQYGDYKYWDDTY